MAKKSEPRQKIAAPGPNLFAQAGNRRRRGLILRKYLAEEADKAIHRSKKRDQAFELLQKWAKLETKGHLVSKKETALDASFLLEVFGDALGYKPATQSPEKYYLERNFTVPGVGTADGAVGVFVPGTPPSPTAVIELKAADTNLD